MIRLQSYIAVAQPLLLQIHIQASTHTHTYTHLIIRIHKICSQSCMLLESHISTHVRTILYCDNVRTTNMYSRSLHGGDALCDTMHVAGAHGRPATEAWHTDVPNTVFVRNTLRNTLRNTVRDTAIPYVMHCTITNPSKGKHMTDLESLAAHSMLYKPSHASTRYERGNRCTARCTLGT